MRRLLPLFVGLGLVLAACQASPGTSSSPGTSQAPGSEAPFTAMSYPAAGPQACNTADYTGEMSQIKALDQYTVEFDLCNPDPAFLSKVAFSAMGIQDTATLEANMANHVILSEPNGTGPYMLTEWVRGDHITLTKNPNYWGTAAISDQLVFRWSTESSARLLALEATSGGVDGIDNPGPDDMSTISDNPDLQLIPRAALNVMYVGFTNTFAPWSDQRVRKAIALAIDRQRIVDNFYPANSTVATHFTPCEIPLGCEGDDWYAFDPALTEAKQLMADAGFPNGFSTKLSYRNVVRGYLPDPVLVATDIQAQLKANLNIDVTLDEQESGTFLDNSAAGKLDGLYLLGWGADYPDPTNFLDYHFNGQNIQFGEIPDSITGPLKTAGSTADTEARTAAYVEANNAIKDFIPMVPVAHGASATAWKADVTGAHASPLTSERFSVMDPGGRPALIWMQNAEPISLYCGDETDGETLRICEQINESLYNYKVGLTDVEPALATECTPNTDASVWTCTLRQGVTFHNGAGFDANDVVESYALQWDPNNPLHVGRTGDWEYWGAFWGAQLPVVATP
jgi:ABC-type transport system substrate-binding protein